MMITANKLLLMGYNVLNDYCINCDYGALSYKMPLTNFIKIVIIIIQTKSCTLNYTNKNNLIIINVN